MLAGPHHVGLIGDDHAPGCRIEYLRIEFGEMAFANGGVIGGEHIFRPPPRPVPFNDAGDGDIADRKFFHTFPSHAPSCGLAPDARPFGSRALRKTT